MALSPEIQTREPITFGSLSTRSLKMQPVLAALERAAGSDEGFLIEGETGVGKELAAEAIHRSSRRRLGALVVFDCAAQSSTDGERELFGLEHTDAGDEGSLLGTLELARGGTLLLDHIDELARPLQLKLARVLKRGEFRRLGGRENLVLNVRVIATSIRGLRREVRLRSFAPELCAVACSESVRIPPLRERTEDIEHIAGEILATCVPSRSVSDIPAHVWAAFHDYHWPGNVRELRNALERALVVPDRAPAFIRRTHHD